MLSAHAQDGDVSKRRIEFLANNHVEISPLAYIRGRTLHRVYFIVDEAQNLTPHEIKTIITRAGEGTKIVFTVIFSRSIVLPRCDVQWLELSDKRHGRTTDLRQCFRWRKANDPCWPSWPASAVSLRATRHHADHEVACLLRTREPLVLMASWHPKMHSVSPEKAVGEIRLTAIGATPC